MPHLSAKSTSQDCVCWFLWFLLRRPKHSSPLPFLNFLSTSSGMRIKRSHVVSFLSFVTSRCQTDVLAGTWWTKSKMSNGDNLNMRWEIRFLTRKADKWGGGGEPAWRATSPPDASRADMTWNDPWGFPHSSWHKTSNTLRSRRRLAALAHWDNIITRRL